MKIAGRERDRERGGERGREGGNTSIHNSVRIMSLTTAALTLPDVDRFQMSPELERCQVLLSSVDIFRSSVAEARLSTGRLRLCARVCAW